MNGFTFESARHVSGNIAGLCVWVRSMVQYHEVAQHVLPKIQHLEEVTRGLAHAQELLHEAQIELQEKVGTGSICCKLHTILQPMDYKHIVPIHVRTYMAWLEPHLADVRNQFLTYMASAA